MKDIYNKLSNDYDILYHQNILQFKKKLQDAKAANDYFVDFYPSFGINPEESADFIVYGQAVNSWGSGFMVDDEFLIDRLTDSILSSNDYLSERNHTPLDWVNIQWSESNYQKSCQDEVISNFYQGKYRACRSFFWNVTYKLICDYYNFERSSFDWSKKLVYSNLYKIAPDEANPNSLHKEIQQEFSIELVKREIQEIKPKYCIVLTNLNWWLPFREGLNTNVLEFDNSLNKIVSLETIYDLKIIVTQRPRFGNSDIFVNQILELIKEIEKHSP